MWQVFTRILPTGHIRYGKTGGIAYRHVADNYIALFSRFIGCGTYEATFILDALLQNLSDVKPSRVHADINTFADLLRRSATKRPKQYELRCAPGGYIVRPTRP